MVRKKRETRENKTENNSIEKCMQNNWTNKEKEEILPYILRTDTFLARARDDLTSGLKLSPLDSIRKRADTNPSLSLVEDLKDT